MTDAIKASNGYVLESGRTESAARSDIAAGDRKGWFPGTRALGAYGVMSGKDGREVARCAARYDRDQIVAMARAFDDMRHALEMIRDADEDCKSDGLPRIPEMARAAIDAALLKASGVKP